MLWCLGWYWLLGLTGVLGCSRSGSPEGHPAHATVRAPTSDGTNPATNANLGVAPSVGVQKVVTAGAKLTAVWANEGGDKITQDELRASRGASVKSSVWDGTTVRVFGARNEVVAFNLVLESANGKATALEVEFDQLSGPGGSVIQSRKVNRNDVFTYVDRNIELFYVRYLQILGVSRLAYDPSYDERHVPKRFRLPFTLPKGKSSGTFAERPDANKFYPDIAVPIEAVGRFDIEKGHNQSIWVDIYIPKDTRPGIFKGNVAIREGNERTQQVPVELEVVPFTLPDKPAAPTMVYFSNEDVNDRYVGKKYPEVSDMTPDQVRRMLATWKAHHLVAHRHKISLVDDGLSSPERLLGTWGDVLSGALFTEHNGYAGPGSAVGNGVYSIGTYGAWRGEKWNPDSQQVMWDRSVQFASFFQKNFPGTEYFLYLLDEPTKAKFADVERWASWVKRAPAPGNQLRTLVTSNLLVASQQMPSVDIAFAAWGDTGSWQTVVDRFRKAGRAYWAYNGWRPSTGSFATEDDGVALRVVAWTQFKLRIARWFYWESTYYRNLSQGAKETNVFREAQTFGLHSKNPNPKYGETGSDYNNGDGVLFYPGTEVRYPRESYGLAGPIASVRLKLWRRGIQDVDYLAMARTVDPARVDRLIQRMIPKVLWEVGVSDPSDPTYVHTEISWPTDPNVWESARRELADIIASRSQPN